jgi:hypothetical protein
MAQTLIVISTDCAIFRHVNRLTKQEQLVLCVVLGLLLTGWAVKTYRTAHPRTLHTSATPGTPETATRDVKND